MLVLGIETATRWCGVALWNDDGPVAARSFAQAMNLSSRLVPTIQWLLLDEGLEVTDLGGISISLGPGSFTGLRIGIATAKTLAQALDVPIIGIPTIEVLRHPLQIPLAEKPPIRLAVTLTSRRGEYYVSGLDSDEIQMMKTEELRSAVQASPQQVILLGDAAAAPDLQDLLNAGPGLSRPNPLVAAQLGHQRLSAGEADELMQLTPLYIGKSAAEERRESQP
jgi:tRNA threonylcarbamoyladenosine biosynthesis protein TsaB